MGFGVSASYAIVAFAVISALGILFVSIGGVAETITEAEQEGSQVEKVANSQFAIQDASYSDGYLSITLKNTGTVPLTLEDTDVLVDGRYVAAEDGSYAIEGISGTSVWNPAEVLRIALAVNQTRRVKIVTGIGVAETAQLPSFRQLPRASFVNNSTVRSVADNEAVTNHLGDADALGPVVGDFTTSGVPETPAVTEAGSVIVTTPNGVTTLATNARAELSRLGVGYWQNSDSSVFFVNADGDTIRRVTATGKTSTVANVSAQGVAGPGDINGDGRAELIFGGNGPDGVSNSVVFVGDDGDVVGTGIRYGTSSGIGLGEPADFNQDGKDRVPVVDDSNDILLAGNGTTARLTTTQPAAKAPLTTANVDGDARPEIVFVALDETLKYIDDVTETPSVVTLRDAQSETVEADADAGTA